MQQRVFQDMVDVDQVSLPVQSRRNFERRMGHETTEFLSLWLHP
jgi:hypothetical protein